MRADAAPVACTGTLMECGASVCTRFLVREFGRSSQTHYTRQGNMMGSFVVRFVRAWTTRLATRQRIAPRAAFRVRTHLPLHLAIGLVTWVTVAAPACKRKNPVRASTDAPIASRSSNEPNLAASGCGPHAQGARYCEGAESRVCETGKETVLATCLNMERCDGTTGTCQPACPEGEVYIPATGPDGFKMGRDRVRNREDRSHIVVLTRPFCIDETEVTAEAYATCVDAGECKEPGFKDPWATWRRHPDYPQNLVSWIKAKNYCEKQGKSLPTEAQWDWATTGGDGREFPWGNEQPTCEYADFAPTGAPKWSPGGDWGCHGGGPSAVKSHPKGAREWPTGKIYDLAGNVWEWMLDSFAPFPAERQVDPVAADAHTIVHTIRGGGWNRPAAGANAWYRGGAVETYQVPGLGFRCVRNPK